jgi:hypothetical protein
MEINLDIGLVNAQYDESKIHLDAENSVSGILLLTGVVDAEWREAFAQSAPEDAPWQLEEAQELRFGPIPIHEFGAYLATLRNQITQANESVHADRHKRAMAEYLDAEERARAHRQAIEALSNMFGRRLSTIDPLGS